MGRNKNEKRARVESGESTNCSQSDSKRSKGQSSPLVSHLEENADNIMRIVLNSQEWIDRESQLEWQDEKIRQLEE